MTYLMMAVAAALAFTLGGVLMKLSDGLTRPLPTAGLLVLFSIGAALNALLVKHGGELSTAYLVVLAFEGVLAFGFGVGLFGERVSSMRVLGLALLLAGLVLLERGADAGTQPPAPASAQSLRTGP